MSDAIWSDAVAQAAAIRSGEATASELLREYLDRIERFDPLLRAYVALDVDRAVADAGDADAAVSRGSAELAPYLGVTISVKDVIDVAGLATTESSKALVGKVAAIDGPLVQRLREAGFIVLGKTNVPEFCSTMTSSELNGICRNPWDPERTPAGSSGGAAAALAAALCAVAHGTDGAGSVRVPAAFCGLVGTKPTRGFTSFGPERGNPYYVTSVDGILSRTVRDAAALLDVFAGVHDRDPSWPGRPSATLTDVWQEEPGSLRIAVTTTPPMGATEPECADATTAVADVLASLGHRVEERTPRWEAILVAALGPMNVPGPAGDVGLDQIDLVEPRNRPLVERGATYTVVEHARWVEECRAAALDFLQFWDDVDVLLTPTCGMLPPSVDWAPWDQSPEEHMTTFMTFPNFAQPFNLSGQPALSLPVAWSAGGLPIGMQLAGRRFDEATLLRLAGQLEQAIPWSDRRPALVA
jgi:amidase